MSLGSLKVKLCGESIATSIVASNPVQCNVKYFKIGI